MVESTNPLRFGVLGTGRITRKVGPAIARTTGTELAAVASRDADRAAAWAAAHGAARCYGSYAALLDDPDLDAVYVALPAALHHEWTVKAAERGLHVLCEKPLAPSLAEAAEMVEVCRERNVQLMDGVMWVHTPRAAEMRAVIDSGTLGSLRRVTSAFTIHPDHWTPTEPRLDALLGGGSLLDLGWYCIGAALWAFGELPSQVRATAEFRGGVDVALSALLDFSDSPSRSSRTAGFDCGFTTAMRKWIEIAGDEGSLVCDDFARARSPEKTRFWLHGRWGEASEVRCSPSVQEEDLVAAFCEAARTGPVHSWADTTLSVQRVCEAILTAAREERMVDLTGR